MIQNLLSCTENLLFLTIELDYSRERQKSFLDSVLLPCGKFWAHLCLVGDSGGHLVVPQIFYTQKSHLENNNIKNNNCKSFYFASSSRHQGGTAMTAFLTLIVDTW